MSTPDTDSNTEGEEISVHSTQDISRTEGGNGNEDEDIDEVESVEADEEADFSYEMTQTKEVTWTMSEESRRRMTTTKDTILMTCNYMQPEEYNT